MMQFGCGIYEFEAFDVPQGKNTEASVICHCVHAVGISCFSASRQRCDDVRLIYDFKLISTSILCGLQPSYSHCSSQQLDWANAEISLKGNRQSCTHT